MNSIDIGSGEELPGSRNRNRSAIARAAVVSAPAGHIHRDNGVEDCSGATGFCAHCSSAWTFSGGLPPLLGVLFQTAVEHVGETLREYAQIHRFSLFSPMSARHLIEHQAQSKDVGAGIARLGLQLLRCHVGEGSLDKVV